jgi:hypothetical protein
MIFLYCYEWTQCWFGTLKLHRSLVLLVAYIGCLHKWDGRRKLVSEKKLLKIRVFTAPICTTTIITLEPCALNAEFQHFIPRFNKTSSLKEGIGGWKEAQRQGEDRMTLRKNSIISPTNLVHLHNITPPLKVLTNGKWRVNTGSKYKRGRM